MANKRMFSMDIVDSDLFLDMPLSSQCLYFHLSMRADDDGFVNSPKKIIKIIGANEDDLKILITKGFVIAFQRGIIVITHWKINNYIRKDRYKETFYIEEKEQLFLTQNGSYEINEGPSLVNQRSTSGQPSIDKDRVDKNSLDEGSEEEKNKDPTSAFYGQFQNVKLTNKENEDSLEQLGCHTQTMIDKLSRYLKSTGKQYKNHYATILSWYEEDKEKLAQKKRSSIPTIEDYKRGEHL